MFKNVFLRKVYWSLPYRIRAPLTKALSLRTYIKMSKRKKLYEENIKRLDIDSERKKEMLVLLSEYSCCFNHSSVFPDVSDSRAKKYLNRDVCIKKDSSSGMYYVLLDGKKLFCSRTMKTKQDINIWFNCLSMEQDYSSPHRYLTNNNYLFGVLDSQDKIPETDNQPDFSVMEGDIVIDVGAAEGNFALSVIDKVKKIYLIECDDSWCEALEQTFLPYKDKVVIIKKYLSDIDSDDSITYNTLIKEYNIERIDLIKMDIEGFENKALEGGILPLSNSYPPPRRMAICLYHRFEDEEVICKSLSENGYDYYLTNGYMVFPFDYPEATITSDIPVRKALVRAYKNN